MSKVVLLLVMALVVAVGVAGVVAGEADDSPGLQLLGALIALGALVVAIRSVRRGRLGDRAP